MRRVLDGLESESFVARLSELSRASHAAWGAALGAGFLFTVLAATVTPYPYSLSGKFWAYASVMVRAGLYVWAGDRLRGRGGETLHRLFKLGLAAGLFEVLVDWWLIRGVTNGRLVYLTGSDVTLLGSPIWMPVARACVITELGYGGLWFYREFRQRWDARKTAAVSSAIIAVAAGMTIGVYEVLAYRAGWWRYRPANVMLGPSCALYVPVGEALAFLALLPVGARVIDDRDQSRARYVECGGLFAAAIGVGYALAYLLLEAGRPPG